jgi:O-antigen/teichoic acid export membrane protein
MLFKFATLLGFLIVEPFSRIWNVKRFEIANEDNGPTIIAKVFTIFLSVLLFFGLVLSLQIPLLLKVLTPSEFWICGGVAGLAVLSRILIASYYHFFFGLIYAKKTYKISIIQWVSATVSLCLGLIFIRRFGILGAVSVSCITNLVQCAIAYSMAISYYRIPFEWRKLIKIFFGCIVFFIVINWLRVDESIQIIVWIKGQFLFMLEALLKLSNISSTHTLHLINFFSEKFFLFVESIIKFLLSFLFLYALIFYKVLPENILTLLLKTKSFVRVFEKSKILENQTDKL